MPGLTQSFSAESCSMSEYYDAVEENNAESVSDSSSEVRIYLYNSYNMLDITSIK